MNNTEFNNYYKRVYLYEQFLRYLYNLDNFEACHAELVTIIEIEGRFKDASINLVAYVDRNNGQLPDNLQVKFNEWLLTHKL